eukprot:5700452-Ditylum_brightwellii.AAC.1
MDKALFHQHVNHFSQAEETPPTVAPITDFGKYAEEAMGVAFREGKLDLEKLNVDKYTKEFLKELQQKTTDPPCINTQLSANDVKRNYKNWRETTSTSPANQHLGLYKTWVNVPEEKDKEYLELTSD